MRIEFWPISDDVEPLKHATKPLAEKLEKLNDRLDRLFPNLPADLTIVLRESMMDNAYVINDTDKGLFIQIGENYPVNEARANTLLTKAALSIAGRISPEGKWEDWKNPDEIPPLMESMFGQNQSLARHAIRTAARLVENPKLLLDHFIREETQSVRKSTAIIRADLDHASRKVSAPILFDTLKRTIADEKTRHRKQHVPTRRDPSPASLVGDIVRVWDERFKSGDCAFPVDLSSLPPALQTNLPAALHPTASPARYA